MTLIIDSTYLLPLARIGVDTDLLLALDEEKIKLSDDDLAVSLISIFELQAKATKLNINPRFISDSIDLINTEFRIEPFYSAEIIKTSAELLKVLNDYIDCIIVATSVVLNEDLITEDRKINNIKKFIKDKYGINVFNYHDLKKKHPNCSRSNIKSSLANGTLQTVPSPKPLH